MGARGRTVPQVVERIASRQHGVVARAQLLAAGVTRREIARRLQSGALLVEFRGVYRVGHRAPSTHARYMAAVLACGEGALLRGRAAGHLLGVLKGPAPPPEVTAPKQRRIEGIAIKRSRRVHSLDATTWHGIPTTTAPPTLVDPAPTPPPPPPPSLPPPPPPPPMPSPEPATRPASATKPRPPRWRRSSPVGRARP